MHRSRTSLKPCLDRGAPKWNTTTKSFCFIVHAKPMGLRARTNAESFNKLTDKIEVDALLDKRTRIRRRWLSRISDSDVSWRFFQPIPPSRLVIIRGIRVFSLIRVHRCSAGLNSFWLRLPCAVLLCAIFQLWNFQSQFWNLSHDLAINDLLPCLFICLLCVSLPPCGEISTLRQFNSLTL